MTTHFNHIDRRTTVVPISIMELELIAGSFWRSDRDAIVSRVLEECGITKKQTHDPCHDVPAYPHES